MPRDAVKGTWLVTAGYLIWGLLPLYWKALESAGAEMVLAHRIVWALVFTTGFVFALRLWPEIRQAFTDLGSVLRMIAGAALISVNWWIYIWAIGAGHVVEAAMGYYINPLLTVLLGVVFLGERLSALQTTAFLLAAAGVLVMALGLGSFPYVAFGLALSFASYSLLKKKTRLGALASLQMETLFSVPLALVLLLPAGGFFGSSPDATQIVLLVIAGPVTAVPLWLFGAGTKLISLTRVGFLQYITPTMTLLLGLFAFGEYFDVWRAVGFAGIWLGLTVFTFDSVRRARA